MASMLDEYESYDSGELLKSRYLKITDLSEGSYGLVSLAKDIKDENKLVAVKFIYPLDYKKGEIKDKESRPSSSPATLKTTHHSNSKKNKASILKALYDEAEKEISIHKILGLHPNVVSLYCHFDSCLVLEFCSRGDLYEAIQNGKGPATSQDIKDVFYQILCALEYCHSHSVFHRDLKPENILIAEDWTIKLCDWGLATTERRVANKNEFDIGSERYMAPELFDTDLESYDASKIDLWSIGIILLTLVFHKNPFQVANYSDKKFMQFVNNREILFDIFSTMSGGLFSVLRYCLNLDPNNRELTSLKSELDNIKYFTIDEEYWASEYEEEDEPEHEEEEDYYNDETAYFFKPSTERSLSLSPKGPPSIVASDYTKENIEPKHSSSSGSPGKSETIKSNMSKDSSNSEELAIPHNHRADALLSSNTDLKPIPISGHNLKFVRNTRKPFNVASYNQPSNQASKNSSNSRFNREDFFTPKSVFNHYMDKYGEQRQSNNFNKGMFNQDWKKRSKYRRSWKKSKNNNNNNANGNWNNAKLKNKAPTSNIRINNPSENNAHNYYNRRKSSSFSTSKSRKNVVNNNYLANSVNNINLPNSNSINLSISNNSTGGKYIPPFLRSPNYTRSPVVGPLTEEIEKLNLDNDESNDIADDGVFHLEDDFDLGSTSINFQNSQSSNLLLSKPHSLPSTSSSTGDLNFKKPTFKAPTYAIPKFDHINGQRINVGSSNNSSNGSRTVRNDLFNRPSSAGVESSSECGLRSSSVCHNSSGKYVPPFRRGSHSAISSHSNGGKHISLSIDKKRDDFQNLHHHCSKQGGFSIDKLTSSSVPSEKNNWLQSKRDWNTYESK